MGRAPPHLRCGIFLLMPWTGGEVDSAWSTVAKAMARGELGHVAKVSTQPDGSGKHVVCIYCHDFSDCSDMQRIAQRLVELGLGTMLQPGFKPDLFTYLGIYSGNRWGLPATCFQEIIQAAREAWPRKKEDGP